MKTTAKKHHFVSFDKAGNQILQLNKHLKPFVIVEKYFHNFVKNQTSHVLDFNSQDRIWGALFAFINKSSEVSLFILKEEHEVEKKVSHILKQNNISNTSIVGEVRELYNKQQRYYDLILTEHQWDDNPTIIYNRIGRLWNNLEIGGKILIISHKSQGAKSLLAFFQDNGLQIEIVYKGRGGVRLIELNKTKGIKEIRPIRTIKTINFNFAGKEYCAFVDNAVFSKERLDSGTEFLLKVFFANKIDLNGKKIGDLGSGWGVISLILTNEFPAAKILAIEKDTTSFLLTAKNLASYPQVESLQADLSDISLLTATHEETLDYIISNPPFHNTTSQLRTFFLNIKKMLKKDGEIFFVVEKSFSNKFKKIAEDLLIPKSTDLNEKYFVYKYQRP